MMYVPSHYHQPDLKTLHDFIQRNSFGLLVSQLDGLPFATHLPFLLERESGEHGTLVGHTARANPQCAAAKDQTVLAVFSGPHSYISPSWYEAENVVPTWNYIAVHAIEKLEGKWKLSQNHPVERQEKVVEALSSRGDENSQAISKMMSDRLIRSDAEKCCK